MNVPGLPQKNGLLFALPQPRLADVETLEELAFLLKLNGYSRLKESESHRAWSWSHRVNDTGSHINISPDIGSESGEVCVYVEASQDGMLIHESWSLYESYAGTSEVINPRTATIPSIEVLARVWMQTNTWDLSASPCVAHFGQPEYGQMPSVKRQLA